MSPQKAPFEPSATAWTNSHYEEKLVLPSLINSDVYHTNTVTDRHDLVENLYDAPLEDILDDESMVKLMSGYVGIY